MMGDEDLHDGLTSDMHVNDHKFKKNLDGTI